MKKPVSLLTGITALAVAYFFLGKFCFSLSLVHENVTMAVFVPEGVALAVILLWGPRFGWGVFLGQFFLAFLTGIPLVAALIMAAGNALQNVLAAHLLKSRFGLHLHMDRLRDMISLVAVVVFISQPLSATIGLSALAVVGLLPETNVPFVWFAWWLGNVMGQILITPALLALVSRPVNLPAALLPEIVINGVVILLLTWLIFALPSVPGSLQIVLLYILFPITVWSAIRLGFRIAACGGLLVVAVALIATVAGMGPFATGSPSTQLIHLYSYILAISLTGFFVATLFNQRRRAEEALRLSEEQYRSLFDHIPVGLYHTTPDGRILNVNPAFLNMYGFQSLAAVQKLNLETDLDLGYSREQFRDRLEKEGELKGLESLYRRPDGSVVFFRENVRLIRNGKGEPLFYAGQVEDITEQKKIQNLKDDLISIVAHELRTPLTSVNGSLEMLLLRKKEELSERARELVEIAMRGTGRLIRLTDDLLDIDKIESGTLDFDLQQHSLADLLQNANESNRMFAGQHGVTLDLDPLPSDIRIRTDSDRFLQIMTNLISNAVKFSPPGETVRIKVTLQNNTVRISVSDRGPGIPEEFRAKVFQRFAQARTPGRPKSGSGLGLSITKAIVEKLGGQVGFETIEGAGTTFYIDLPLGT